MSRIKRWTRQSLKYLLIWPLFRAYRRKLRRSVRWRLADSHITAVWSSVLGLCVILVVVIFATSWFAFPAGGEAPEEADAFARIVERVQSAKPMTNDQLSVLLVALSTGKLTENLAQGETTIQANVGGQLSGATSISIVGLDGVVLASTNNAYLGRQIGQAIPTAAGVASLALTTGTTDPDKLSVKAGSNGAVAAAQMHDSTGARSGILVLEKSKLSYPTSLDLVRAGLRLIGELGLTVLVFIGIPAIPISIVIGIKRGRAISKPITALEKAGEQLANGDLSARVLVSGEDEIARLQTGFNDMARWIQDSLKRESEQRARSDELLAANRELVANVSHELRTPVALIRGHLEAIENDPAATRDYLRIAVRETDRLERLVDDLFQLTRLESKGLDLELAPFDPASAAREAVEALAEPARREAGILVRAESTTRGAKCLGDRSRFVQVLMNLIRNAIRYTPEGGIILVTSEGRADTIEIAVRDTGSGIPPDDLPHIFDRFYRADPSRNRGSGGAGLGLSIARDLIAAMGGTISARSVLDEGTVFTIAMPRARSQSPAESGYSLSGVSSK